MKIEEKSALLVIDIQQEDFVDMNESNMDAPEWECIHYTAVDAHQNDYYIRVVKDAVAGSSEEAHKYALKAIQYLQRDALITTADVESAR